MTAAFTSEIISIQEMSPKFVTHVDSTIICSDTTRRKQPQTLLRGRKDPKTYGTAATTLFMAVDQYII